MAVLILLEKAVRVCNGPKCGGRATRQNLIEITAAGKTPVKEWICTECNTKTRAEPAKSK